jgi:hypothetical protein
VRNSSHTKNPDYVSGLIDPVRLWCARRVRHNNCVQQGGGTHISVTATHAIEFPDDLSRVVESERLGTGGPRLKYRGHAAAAQDKSRQYLARTSIARHLAEIINVRDLRPRNSAYIDRFKRK